MAQMTPPTWTAEDGTQLVTTLPSAITVKFRVTSRTAGFLVHYRLHSTRVNFRSTSNTPPMTAKEKAGSTPSAPPLDPQSRELRVIDDAYPAQPLKTSVERALELELSGSDNPGIATLEITVTEMDGTKRDDDSVALAFSI